MDAERDGGHDVGLPDLGGVRTDEDRTEFLRKRGFGKADTKRIIDTVLAEEGHPPASIFDFVQRITALAREKPHQNARLDLEARAKKLLDRAA